MSRFCSQKALFEEMVQVSRICEGVLFPIVIWADLNNLLFAPSVDLVITLCNMEGDVR